MEPTRLPSPIDADEQDREWQRLVRDLAPAALPFDRLLQAFRTIYARRAPEDGPPRVWQPDAARIRHSNLWRLINDRGLAGYRELHGWSVDEREQFWHDVIERLGIAFATDPTSVLDPSGGPTAPRWLPGARMSCVDSCFRAAHDDPAIISGGEGTHELRTTSFGELERMTDAVARGLKRSGFERGDGIALYMPMNLECVAAYLGIIRAGLHVVSIADSFSASELRKRVETGDARGIITVERLVRGGRSIDLYGKVREARVPRAVVIPASPGGPSNRRPGDSSWEEFLEEGDGGGWPDADPYDLVNVLFSSGTSGTPKAVPWNHLTPIKCAMDGHYHQDIHAGDVVAWPTNVGWMMGPWLIFAGLINRATIALYEGSATGSGFPDFVRDAGVTMLGVVPALVRAWRAAWGDRDLGWSRIDCFSSTGEPSDVEDYLWLMSRAGFRAPVVEYCGGTEIGGGYVTGTVVQAASPATFTTPALGLDFVLLDEDGQAVDDGETGQAFLVPPSIGLSQSLLNRDHDEVYHAGCPRGPQGEVLRRHGDQLVRLPGGFYRARGRADDTMNLGGIKISSLELENVVGQHDAVYESAAVAVQPEGGGADRLVLFVVAETSIDPGQLLAELGSLVAARLNPLFRVHDLVLTRELPRTASNKLMRRRLRSEYVERHGSS